MTRKVLGFIGVIIGWAAPAAAQLDPLLFMKVTPPNVIVVVDTANRMQRDAPTDSSTLGQSQATSNYYDPYLYPLDATKPWQAAVFNVTALNTTAIYRRKYTGLVYSNNGTDKFNTASIEVTRDQDAGYALFEASTRLAIARAAMYQAINENKNVARFGLIRTRQSTPAPATQGNAGPVVSANPAQKGGVPTERADGKWNVSRPIVTVSTNNGAVTTSGLLIGADAASANDDVLSILARDARQTNGSNGTQTLLPSGNDDGNTFDTPVNLMLTDAKSEAARLIALTSIPTCCNTIVVLIVGGGEGTTTTGATNATLGTKASEFVGLSGRRVPIYVIAIAPPATDVAGLQAVATNSGGQYFEITKAQIDAALQSTVQKATAGVTAPAGTIIVPEVVNAINVAVQHGFASSADVNANLTQAAGKSTEFQVTSPVIGTVNLNMAKDINGATLPSPQPPDVKDKLLNVIPQRNNVMVTTGVVMPGFDAQLRAFRVYKPVSDASQPSGWKFTADGTRLWVAKTPSDPNQRNLYTATAAGTLVAFTTANVETLKPLMNLDTADALAVITAVRSLPLGPILDSTPAFLNPPSLDPPPDAAYPGFAAKHKDRRTLIWAGSNRGILEAVDARTGLEVWGFIPLNLLPKLRTLRDGQPVGKFDFFVDSSAKLADVRLSGICASEQPSDCWRTHLIIGEGPGGTFYQSLDVTMDNIATCVAPDNDLETTLLNCFKSDTLFKLNWAFPSYSNFDPCAPLLSPCSAIATYGDVSALATPVEKSVGQTWSDPAVGQILTNSGPYSVLVGSGFLPYSTEQQTNRGGAVAGTTFYILDAKTGAVSASSNVGSDNKNETVNDCTTNTDGCKRIKNALQTDPVATGPSDQRFVTKVYIGDLDGRVWRFDVTLDADLKPSIAATNKLFETGDDQPIFGSMATVNVGGTNQYVFFGTGSDLLPSTDINTTYRLMGVLDKGGATGTEALKKTLQKTNSKDIDEKVTAFPAVAGDLVFFTTTNFNGENVCLAPNANLYAFTFIGGAAYDTNNDGVFDKNDSTLVKTVAGQRATAPFIVDQHLVFAAGGKVEMLGDPDDFNNGIGQAGVRILSWREVR